MIDLIDGKTPLEVLKLQRKHLDWLQDIIKGTGKDKPLLIKAKPGAKQDGDSEFDYNWVYYKDAWPSLDAPIYTRGILKNELMFDLDNNNYREARKEAQKLKDYLDENKIPYWMAFSGNRSLHFHIFSNTFDIDNTDFEKAITYGLDVYKITRMALAKALFEQSGADPVKMGIDWKKISFDMHRRGSMIREFGTVRDNGKYKTKIDAIPDQIPDYLPLCFPEKVPDMWNFSDTQFHVIARSAIKAEIEKAERNQEFDLESIDFKDKNPIDFPCMRNVAMSGVKDGGRYYMAVSGTLLCKKCGLSEDETHTFVSNLLSSCNGLSQADHKLRLDNALKVMGTDLNFSCRVFKENVGVEYCDFAHCPLKEKIQAVKEQKPIDWKTPLKNAVMETQDTDPETKIKAAKDILFNVLAEMSPIARMETFMGCICPDLKISSRAATNIYKDFERSITISRGADWFNEKGKFVPPVMSERVRDKYTFATLTDTKEIWVYDEETGCYRPGGDVIIKQYTQTNLGLSSKKNHIEEVVNHVGIETYTDRSIFDSDPESINLRNGYYNIYNHTFHEHTPDKMFTYSLPFQYNPNAKCPNFERHLERAGVNKNLIYEIFGYCLVPGYPIQAIFIFYGDGGNGKGTVIRVLRQFLGEENIVGHSMQAFEKNKYAMADLFGKLANICGDMPPAAVHDTSPIKTTSGGDLITAPVIYRGNITFENRAKSIFLLNHLPEFDDNTDSFDRRLVFQEFNNRVVGLDSDFKEADMWTDEELSGIFNKCMDVLPDLLKRGYFTGMKTIQENRAFRQRKGNPIGTFIEECTFQDDMKYCPTVDTYAAYVKWCTENNETCLPDNVFGRTLLQKYPEFKKTRPRIDGIPTRCYSGFYLMDKYSGLDISEELEKYENSKGYNKDTERVDSTSSLLEDGKNPECVIRDTLQRSRIDPGLIHDKKSDFSNTVDVIGVFDPGYPSKLSQKKITGSINDKNIENDDKKNSVFSFREVLANIPDHSKKQAEDTESIPDQSWITQDNIPDQERIEECLDQWEKFGGVIFSKNAHKAKLDIVGYHKMYGINPQLIYNAIDKRVNSRCVDCGNVDAPNRSESITGVTQHRCRDCYIEYQKLTPVKLPEIEVV